ncbi:MAG: pirin-like C-terminal cupin domain-containing protein [Pseudomonadota bacterium]|nr:pirin-like C-terminal cupin domain-containing protein [Pseudomonadota bacterium]
MTMQTAISATGDGAGVSGPVEGEALVIGDGFRALSFRHGAFDGLMDPLVMVDHFTMTEPTFGAHPHAGMSAVSVLFEDSVGVFNNRDSLGHDIDLLPGDLYWLKAGRGAVHDEAPRPGARTHALQVFVNLPAHMKQDAPESLHVPAGDIPVIEGEGHRVRVVLGESNGIAGAQAPGLPLGILDIRLAPGGGYTHRLPDRKSIWVLAIDGNATLRSGEVSEPVRQGHAVALRPGPAGAPVSLQSEDGAQLVLFEGDPVAERFVQRGPFVMSTVEEIERVRAAFAAGQLGSID